MLTATLVLVRYNPSQPTLRCYLDQEQMFISPVIKTLLSGKAKQLLLSETCMNGKLQPDSKFVTHTNIAGAPQHTNIFGLINTQYMNKLQRNEVCSTRFKQTMYQVCQT